MKALQILFSMFLLGVLILAGVVGYAWFELNNPVPHNRSTEIVNIPIGSSTEHTVQKLTELGIVNNEMLFKLYIKAKKEGALIQAGDYQFPSPISPIGVLNLLKTGGLVPFKFTIIEGWTRWDIAHAIAAMPALKMPKAQNAFALMNDTSSIKDLDPKATNLEGYLFPDTYAVHSTTTAKDIVEASVKRFHEVWKEHLAAPSKERGLTPHQVVTTASIIETEAKLPKERPIVASVIYNRLRQKINLSVDCTVIYASKLAGKWKNDGKVYLSDVNRDSPYNTRKVIGLPPGPVGSPGLASMEATLHPASTNYIYYVRDPNKNDGTHNFYVSAADFEKGVQALRNWEARRDSNLKKQTKKK